MKPGRTLAAAAGLAMLSVACTSSLTTMQPARLTPPGHLAAGFALEAPASSGEVAELIDAAIDGPSSENLAVEAERIARGVATGLVQPPTVGGSLSLSLGLSRRFELSVRTSGTAARAGLRWQFLRAAPGIYGTVGVGVSSYLYGFPLDAVTDEISLLDFSRHELDLPLQLGVSGRIAHFWIGPKLVLAAHQATFESCLESSGSRCLEGITATSHGTARYLAGQVGLAIGHRRFWVAAELTVAKLDVDADLDVTMGRMRSSMALTPSGVVLSPAVGFFIWL